jgi:uncharacterized membrane protein YhiD involved in acid resistance
MAWHHFVAYLLTGLLLGAIIGAERQWHQRIAGLEKRDPGIALVGC